MTIRRWAQKRRRSEICLYAGVLAWTAVGCSVGNGEGQVEGTLTVQDCGWDAKDFTLDPTFFTAAAVADQLEIRIQRASDFEVFSDGLLILVRDATNVSRSGLGSPLVVGPGSDSDISAVLYLSDRCAPNRDDRRREAPVALEAQSGQMVFDAIYAPRVSESDVEVSGTFSNMHMLDRGLPDERFGVLDGDFSFLYVRGRPAQRFP